ncbi:MAG: 3-keto-disaccharide hydrolase, partial [Akkermansiaceae bacterium]
MRLKNNFLCIVALALSSLNLAADPQAGKTEQTEITSRWQPLFNGKDLSGWHPLPGGKWQVKDGTILGTCAKSEKRHGLLVSDKTYKNFILRAKFKVITGDSGLYFRVQKTGTRAGVKGFQAEVDNTPQVGGLYETAGRAWVKEPAPALIKRIYQPGKWTQITITAMGDHITVSLNGTTTTELLADQ